MTDCPNAEMRDRLPDLLHERLDSATRTVVMAHVESCAECRAELTLIREAHVALVSGIRSVDVTVIARRVLERTRVPRASATRQPLRRAAWASLLDWRVAASIAVLVVGGGSVLLMNGNRAGQQPPAVVASPSVSTDAPHVGSSTAIAERTVRHESSTTTVPSRAELSAGGEVGDLSEADLRALLHDLNGMDAVPSTEPEPVVVRVSLPGSGGSE